MKRCDIAVISFNQLSYTLKCLESIERVTRYPHRIIVVDNGSDDATRAYLGGLASRQKIVLLQNQVNEGWVKAVNKAIAFSDADFVCVMNNDTVAYPGWLEEMTACAEKDPRVGLVNPEWEFPAKFPGGREWYYRLVIRSRKGRCIETDWARSFCFLVTRQLVNRIGGLDPEFSPVYYEDWDYSVRAYKSGFTVVRAQGAFVLHYLNVTYKETLDRAAIETLKGQKGMLFHQRWGYPLRILFAGTLPWDAVTHATLVRDLLAGQHRLTMLGVNLRPRMRHTNLRELGTFPFRAAAETKKLLLKAGQKPFDLVVCGLKIKKALERDPRTASAAKILLATNPYNSHDLTRLVSRMKYEKKGSGK